MGQGKREMERESMGTELLWGLEQELRGKEFGAREERN